MIALLLSFLSAFFWVFSKWVLVQVLEHEISPFFSFFSGHEGENRTTDFALQNLTSCRRRHCRECRLNMLRNKPYSYLRLLKSLSTTIWKSARSELAHTSTTANQHTQATTPSLLLLYTQHPAATTLAPIASYLAVSWQLRVVWRRSLAEPRRHSASSSQQHSSTCT